MSTISEILASGERASERHVHANERDNYYTASTGLMPQRDTDERVAMERNQRVQSGISQGGCPGHFSLFCHRECTKMRTISRENSSSWRSRPPHWFQPQIPPWVWKNFSQQTQALANRNARSKQWQPWLAACQRKRLRFFAVFVYATHATQAIACEWKPGFSRQQAASALSSLTLPLCRLQLSL